MLYEVKRDDGPSCGGTEVGEGEPRGVFSLIHCPPIARGNFILVRREESGSSSLLAMGRVKQDCATLNLAQIRRLGAELGANEVHLFPSDQNPGA